MDGVEQLLRLLEDGRWHRLDNVADQLKWSGSKTLELVRFLADHGMVSYRTTDQSVRLDPALLQILQQD